MTVNRLSTVPFVKAGFLLLISLIAAWLSDSPSALLAQIPRQHIQARIVLSGLVVTQSDAPISDAHVVLRPVDVSDSRSAVSDSSGRFTFESLLPGAYTLTCTQGTLHSQTLRIAVRDDDPKSIRLVLDISAKAGSDLESRPTPLAESKIEFSDATSFAVAGVTDWTAVGGHGSDETLRTSESLARKTLTLNLRPEISTVNRLKLETETKKENRLRAAYVSAPDTYKANHDLGMYYLHTDRPQLAVSFLTTASRLSGSKSQDEYEIALACEKSNMFPEAKEHVQLALARTDDPSFHRLLGNLDEKAGDPLSAVQQFERATQLDPSERSYFDWGSELLVHRAIWQAAEVFENGTRAYPSSIRLRTGWGAALFGEDHYSEAAQQFCRASDLNPKITEPYIFMGKIASVSQVLPACIRPRIGRFLKQQPKSPDANYYYASLLIKDGSSSELRAAEILLRDAVAADPQYVEAYLQLGILLSERKHYVDAIKNLQQAIYVDPQQSEAHYRLGVLYTRVGKTEEAKREFAVHDQVERIKADATDQERQQVKQFLIVLKAPEGGQIASSDHSLSPQSKRLKP